MLKPSERKSNPFRKKFKPHIPISLPVSNKWIGMPVSKFEQEMRVKLSDFDIEKIIHNDFEIGIFESNSIVFKVNYTSTPNYISSITDTIAKKLKKEANEQKLVPIYDIDIIAKKINEKLNIVYALTKGIVPPKFIAKNRTSLKDSPKKLNKFIIYLIENGKIKYETVKNI